MQFVAYFTCYSPRNHEQSIRLCEQQDWQLLHFFHIFMIQKGMNLVALACLLTMNNVLGKCEAEGNIQSAAPSESVDPRCFIQA